MSAPPILIPHASGTNRDDEAAQAIRLAGGEPTIAHVNELRSGAVRFDDLDSHQLLFGVENDRSDQTPILVQHRGGRSHACGGIVAGCMAVDIVTVCIVEICRGNRIWCFRPAGRWCSSTVVSGMDITVTCSSGPSPDRSGGRPRSTARVSGIDGIARS